MAGFVTDTNFKALCALLRERADQCLLLVGAGMTSACHGGWAGERENPASWSGLLRNGAQYVAAQVDRALGKQLEAQLSEFEALPDGAEKEAQRAETYGTIGENIWQSLEAASMLEPWLRESIGTLTVGDPGKQILKQVGRLGLGGVSLVTTNYEDFLASELGRAPVTHLDRRGLAAVFAGRSPDRIGHVHGHFSQPESIVLTERQYCALVEREDGAHFGERAAMVHRNWIFVGCGAGLGDPNFSRVLGWMPGYLPLEHQNPCFYIGTEDEWEQVRGLPGFGQLDMRHIPLADHAELVEVLTGLAKAVSFGELQEFGPAISPIRVRLRSEGAGGEDIKPSWQELCDRLLPRNPDDHLIFSAALNDQHVLLIAGNAGSGKSTIGMQLACEAQQRGEAVYWLQMDFDTRLTPAGRRLLGQMDGLVIIDEAQNNYNLTLEILQIAAQATGRLRVISLATKGKTPGSDDIDAETVVQDLHNSGVPVRQHEPRADTAFYRQLGQFLLRRAGKHQLADRIDDAIAEGWHREFRKQVYIFAAALLGSASHLPADWNGSLHIAAAGDWVRRRFRIDDQTRQSQEILAYLAGIAKSKDGSYGWVPALALPHPLAMLDRRARPLLITSDRPGLAEPVYRLMQSDALGQLLWDVLGPDLQQFAQNHDLFDARGLAGRLLMAPQEIGRLATRYAHLTPEQFTAPLFDYRHAFDARLGALSLRIYSTLLTFLVEPEKDKDKDKDKEKNKAVARRFIETADPDWFAIATLVDRSTLDGAGSLANNLFKCGQGDVRGESAFADLANNLSRAIVLRASPDRDFITTQYNLLHLGEVLRSMPEDIDGAQAFIRAVWTPEWIGAAMTRSKPAHFSEVMLHGGRNRSAAVAGHFRRRDLRAAYSGAFAHVMRIAGGHDEGVFAIFQTLGPLYLFGARSVDGFLREGVARNWLIRLDPGRLIRAIEGAVWTEQANHNPAFGPGRYQIKAWLGLRAGLEIAGGQIRIDAAVIRQRLALLQDKIAGAPDPDCLVTPETAIDRSMVRWLEHCLRWQRDGRVPLDGRDMGLRALRDEIWTLPCRQPRAAA